MIVQLTGKLASKVPDHCVVDVSGVGYGVQLSLTTFSDLPEVGESLKLEIYTHVREDQLNLFGFSSTDEKNLFKKLISISGVGQRWPLEFFPVCQPHSLQPLSAMRTRSASPGYPELEKKLHERIIIELKDKMSIDSKDIAHTCGSELIAKRLDGAISALVNLGYKQQTAEEVLRKLKPSDDMQIEEIIRLALKELCRT